MDLTPTQRRDGRSHDQVRTVRTSYNVYEYAAGSVLFELGKTKVLCAVSLQNGVPPFLKGKGTGWLTAEYAMLPTATLTRTQRETSQMRKDGRAVEISRFIGRCFRSIVTLSGIGERTISIDCDVMQADGGTRTAAITGSFLALLKAQEHWLAAKVISAPIVRDRLAAVSVGIVRGVTLLDLNYDEDSIADADFNFVITQSDKIIEMQGGAERDAVSWDQFEEMKNVARKGAVQIFELCDGPSRISADGELLPEQPQRPPFFSLKNRHHV